MENDINKVDIKPLDRYNSIYVYFLVFFVVFVVLTNTVGTKLFRIFDWSITLFNSETFFVLPVSIIFYPFTFLITDVVSEMYGSKRARFLVIMGFSMSLVLLLFAWIGIALTPAKFYNLNEAYTKIFGQAGRLLLGSMAAYLLAQMVDVSLFHFLKKVTKGKHLWLRNNGSTMISQIVDTLTVTFIYLYKNPAVIDVKEGESDFYKVLAIAIMLYISKVIIAALDTPLCYLGVRLVEKATGIKGKNVA